MPPDPSPSSPEPASSPDVSDGSDARWLTCLACGARMEGRQCKLVCTKCGYFQSCSEFD